MKQGYVLSSIFLIIIFGCGILHALPLDLLGRQIQSGYVMPARDTDLGLVASGESWEETIHQFFGGLSSGIWLDYVQPSLAGVFSVRHSRLLERMGHITSLRAAGEPQENQAVTVSVKLFKADFTSMIMHVSLRRDARAPAGWYVQDIWEDEDVSPY